MKAGDRIRVDVGYSDMYTDWKDFSVEEFRFCLGIFLDEDHRKAGDFTPLCELYCDGPDSKGDYISNYGEYRTNQVPAWCDIP